MSLATLLRPPVKNLKAIELARLAKLAGLNHAGRTKSAIAEDIFNAVEDIRSYHNGKRNPLKILSIDMGIQNLAYCRLERPLKPKSHIIKEWRRLSVLSRQNPTNLSAFRGIISTEELARAAVKLVDDLVLNKAQEERPDHILIERQRWRSMGGKNILQWTIRVNTFEAMLWAILQSHRAQGTWTGQIHAIDPARVMAHWLENGSITGTKTSRRYAAVKQAKVDLVREWCSSGSYVASGCDDSKAVFASLQDGKRSGRRKETADKASSLHVGKLDDLADCLLQGVTWLKWLENKQLLAERDEAGVQELLQGLSI